MTQGPYLVSAVICDQVIEGKDGVLSAIRIIDQMSVVQFLEGENKQPQVPLLARIGPLLQFSILVVLKSGDFKGKGKLRLVMKTPSEKSVAEQAVDVELFGQQHGANVIFNVALDPQEAGLYWFEIYFGDKFLTKSPLQIQRVQSAPTTKNGDGAAQSHRAGKN